MDSAGISPLRFFGRSPRDRHTRRARVRLNHRDAFRHQFEFLEGRRLLSGVPESTTNLVLNGGFESFAIPNNSYSLFNAIPGWNLARGHSIELQHNVAG